MFDWCKTLGVGLATCRVPLLFAAACGGEASVDDEIGSLGQEISGARLNVMSMNVKIPDDPGQRSWANRRPRIAEVINAFAGGGPHIIGFQELKTLPGGGNTGAEILASLPDQEYTFFPRDRGDGEMLGIFVRSDRLEVLDSGGRNVSRVQRSRHCGTLDNEDNVNRPIQYVYVRDLVTDRRSYFFNTHFPTQHSCGRHGQSEVLAEYIWARSDQSARVIVAGDFNDGVEASGHVNGSVQRLLDETGYTMAFFWGPVVPSSQFSGYMTCTTSTGVCAARSSWTKDRRVGQMIDLLLLSNPFDLVETGIERSMFTRDGTNTRIVCNSVQSNGLCANTSWPVSDLELYSDHWAVWASLVQ